MKIRVVSPSGKIDPHYIDQAQLCIKAWGIEVTEGRYTRAEWGRFAGRDEQRLADLNDALDDPTVDIVLCARGGYGMQRLIDRVHAISKPIVGFSDITELHLKAGLQMQPTLHTGMCKSIANGTNDQLQAILQGEAVDYNLAIAPGLPMRDGEIEAPVVGGNLSVIYGLQATPYSIERVIEQYNVAPILLIEDIAERPYHIDRMMRNLYLSGVLARIGGLIVGQFTDCEEDPSMPGTIYEIIWDVVKDYTYPVVMNFPIGHSEKNVGLWLHTPTRLRVAEGRVSLHQSSPINHWKEQ